MKLCTSLVGFFLNELMQVNRMADQFEPYGDFDYIVAVPVEDAVANFKQHLRISYDERQKFTEDLRAGISTVETRKIEREIYLKRKEEAELLLFRSIAHEYYLELSTEIIDTENNLC